MVRIYVTAYIFENTISLCCSPNTLNSKPGIHSGLAHGRVQISQVDD